MYTVALDRVAQEISAIHSINQKEIEKQIENLLSGMIDGIGKEYIHDHGSVTSDETADSELV